MVHVRAFEGTGQFLLAIGDVALGAAGQVADLIGAEEHDSCHAAREAIRTALVAAGAAVMRRWWSRREYARLDGVTAAAVVADVRVFTPTISAADFRNTIELASMDGGGYQEMAAAWGFGPKDAPSKTMTELCGDGL